MFFKKPLKSFVLRDKIANIAAVLPLIFLSSHLSAQPVFLASSAADMLPYALILIVAFLILGAVYLISESFVRMEARDLGVDTKKNNFSILPTSEEVFGSSKSEGASTSGHKVIHLKKGFDIKLEGAAEYKVDENAAVTRFAMQPKNFIGMSPIPKVEVEVGDEVQAGDVLFFDKKNPDVKYCAPVSGEVIAVNRGEKRSIAELVILADKEMKYRAMPEFDLENASKEELVSYMKDNGAWAHIRQRPYNVVADSNETPKAIFVSTFDTAPMAPDLDIIIAGRGKEFQVGLDVLNMLTPGKVHLGLNAKDEDPSPVFENATGVEKHWISGPHPAGNVGVQIHHIDPINAGERVWTVGVQDVATIGSLFLEGIYDAERVVAITGAELKEPHYVTTYLGANIGDLVANNLKNDHVRLISGDVLSGKAKKAEQFLDFFDDQVSVIEEGDEYEMFGWLAPQSARPSLSPTFLSNLVDTSYVANTNTHGERRALVVSDQYEQVLPMDIYPQHLVKSILVNDLERMEGLGIYELVEEDVALCEFVCTSKQPVQDILREGLTTMMDQE